MEMSKTETPRCGLTFDGLAHAHRSEARRIALALMTLSLTMLLRMVKSFLPRRKHQNFQAGES